ncbi:helix-hairpin-helix domain-containing protein, partial [Acidobacteriota bacterium]
AGSRDILAEEFAESAGNRARLREILTREAVLQVRVISGKEEEGAVYRDYFEYDESLKTVRSHRLLAILRGEREGYLSTELVINDEKAFEDLVVSWDLPLESPCGRQIKEASQDSYHRLLRPSITNEVRGDAREQADSEAIMVFRSNLESLLLQSPLGQLPVMGLDPGLRTGCKAAVVDRTGKVAATATIYPVGSKAKETEAAQVIKNLIRHHSVHAVAVGNGTACRETEAFVQKTVKEADLDGLIVAIVPETGASIYSASALARAELPGLDVTLRGAVSIARRLQDPLAELVKIEPRSLGVGQYQHDVNQKSLAGELDTAVEGVVNRVGVELNTASSALLKRISGLNERLAGALVAHRNENGPFASREGLLGVSGVGPRTFELAAGFLRIHDGRNPLDRTGVHPERYGVVRIMAETLGVSLEDLVGHPDKVARIDFEGFTDENQGLGSFTLQDIKEELERPGRDPRPEFKAPEWREDVCSIQDLKPGMQLEGRVSNVTNFGAFVDIGVKRDGLVHLSELTHEWVSDPREVVQVGQIVKVEVKEVDQARERIGLSMKALEPLPGKKPAGKKSKKIEKRDKKDNSKKDKSKKEKSRKSPPSVEDLMKKFNRPK